MTPDKRKEITEAQRAYADEAIRAFKAYDASIEIAKQKLRERLSRLGSMEEE